MRWDSACALDALRVHTECDYDVTYPEPQALLRDAFDALLGFLARLETAIQGGLVDEHVVVGYFQYWLKRMHSMEEHTDTGPASKRQFRVVARRGERVAEPVASLTSRRS